MKEWGFLKKNSAQNQTITLDRPQTSKVYKADAYQTAPAHKDALNNSMDMKDLIKAKHFDDDDSKFIKVNSEDELDPEREPSPSVRMSDVKTETTAFSPTTASSKREVRMRQSVVAVKQIDLEKEIKKKENCDFKVNAPSFGTPLSTKLKSIKKSSPQKLQHAQTLKPAPQVSTLTSSNLNKVNNRSKRSMMGSSLINAAMTDVQRVNKVKSEYNAGAGNVMNAGQMFKCMDMANKLSGIAGVGSMFTNPIHEESDKGSVISGTNSFNPFAQMMGSKATSAFNFGPTTSKFT